MSGIPDRKEENNMEKVKFGTTLYDLVVDGVRLTEQGGKVILLPGAGTFDTVKADVQAAKSITVLDDAGEPILMRTDLVYAGRLAQDDNYVIGADFGVGTDVTGTVLIVDFRTPDLTDKVVALEAKIEYLSMMAGIEMEV